MIITYGPNKQNIKIKALRKIKHRETFMTKINNSNNIGVILKLTKICTSYVKSKMKII